MMMMAGDRATAEDKSMLLTYYYFSSFDLLRQLFAIIRTQEGHATNKSLARRGN